MAARNLSSRALFRSASVARAQTRGRCMPARDLARWRSLGRNSLAPVRRASAPNNAHPRSTVRLRVIWHEGDRLVEARERLSEDRQVREPVSQIVVSWRKVRVDLRCPTSFDIADVPSLTSAIGAGYAISRNGSAGRTSLEGVGYHSSASPDVSRVKPGHLDRMGSGPYVAHAAAVRGYGNYHAAPTNSRAIQAFHAYVAEVRRRRLERRVQKDRTTWERGPTSGRRRLSKPDCLYSWPEARFAVTHTGWKPRIGNVRNSAGCARK